MSTPVTPLPASLRSVMCLLAPLLATLSLASAPEARAGDNRLVDATNRWLTDAGFDSRYGLRPQDRPEANDAINRLAKMPLRIQRYEDGGVVQWRSYRKLKVPHQRCALAGLMDATHLWVKMVTDGITERPFHVWIDCDSTAWVKVSLRHAPRRDGFDMMKLEVSFGGKVDYSGEAPLRLKAADFKPRAEGLVGPAYEANLLAQQAWNELTEVDSPVSYLLAGGIGDLPDTNPVCGRDAAVFEGADEVCAMKADTTDERRLAGLALLRLLESIHGRWERGEHRDGLPPTWIFVHGKERRWAYARPVDGKEIELVVIKYYEVTRKRVTVKRRFMADKPTIAAREPVSPDAPSAADLKSRLNWYGQRAPHLVLAMSGDLEKAKGSSMDLAGLLDHLGPVASAKEGGGWASCTPKKGKTPKHCEVRPRVEVDEPACIALGWALAAGVPHMAKPPWGLKEEVTLAVHCHPEEGHRGVSVHRKVAGKNRLAIQVDEKAPPFLAPIDPSKPL